MINPFFSLQPGGGGGHTPQAKNVTLTENGTYVINADEGYDCLSSVTAEVSVGGSSVPDPIEVYNATRPSDWLKMPADDDPSFQDPDHPVIYLLFSIPEGSAGFLGLGSTEQNPVMEFGETDDSGTFTARFTDHTTGSNSYTGDIPSTYAVHTLSNGEKQVLVRYTAQSASGRMALNRSAYRQTNIVEIKTNSSMLLLGNSSTNENDSYSGYFSRVRYFDALEPLTEVKGSSYGRSMFYYWKSLVSVLHFSIPNATYLSSMFRYCYSLKAIPVIEAPNAESLSSMFAYCYSIEGIPDLDFPKVTSVGNCFSYCYNLKRGPYIPLSKVKSLDSMFSYCDSLRSIPEYELSEATSAYLMFQNCSSLKSVRLNAPMLTRFESTFDNCRNLESAVIIGPSVTNASRAFNNCVNLRSFTIDIPNVTNMDGTLQSCGHDGTLDLTNVNPTVLTLPYSCFTVIKGVPISALGTNAFYDCKNLGYLTFRGSYSGGTINLESTALNKWGIIALFNSLPTVTATSTLKFKSSYQQINALSEDEKAIATSKGWTITTS